MEFKFWFVSYKYLTQFTVIDILKTINSRGCCRKNECRSQNNGINMLIE